MVKTIKERYNMTCYFKPEFNYYIVVSTEDHIEYVKGGIGTYLGLLHQAFQKYLKQVQFIWITESPNLSFFVKKYDNHRIFYIPRTRKSIKYKIEKICLRIYKILSNNIKNRIAIEAPDWEGLLSNIFSMDLGNNTLKITRLHSVLALTKQNMKKFTEEEKEQMQFEYKQIECSDFISAPTEYVYNFTSSLLSNNFLQIPHGIIPNFINTNFCKIKLVNREDACNNFNNILNNKIIFAENKNIFCIGSLEYRKGIDIILKIAEILLARDKNIHIYLIGHFEKNGNSLTLNTKYSQEYLKSIISSEYLNNIHICGYIPYTQLNILYNACDTFLFCYRHDNFPGALVEACLTGKNVVYLKRGGCVEMMKNGNRELGIGFDGNNDAELIQNGYIALQKSLNALGEYSAMPIKNKYKTYNLIARICHEYKFKP